MHRPPGDKVALGETVRRALSASSTPRVVFGRGDARRRLARKAPRWTRTVWGLFLASLAAWPCVTNMAPFMPFRVILVIE